MSTGRFTVDLIDENDNNPIFVAPPAINVDEDKNEVYRQTNLAYQKDNVCLVLKSNVLNLT